MKALVILTLLVVVMVFVGWLRFSGSDTTATLTIDKQKVREDVGPALEKAQDALEAPREAELEGSARSR